MNGVSVDAFSEVSTDSASVSFFRVSGTHQFAVLSDRVFTFQNLNNNRARSHETNQITEERTLFVLCVETASFFVVQLQHFCSNNLQASFFKASQDFADYVFSNSIWLDDR